MIWESNYWREDLLRHARSLRQRRRQQVWRARSEAAVEKAVMNSAYALRKLGEAGKIYVPKSLRDIRLSFHPWMGKPVTRLNWHRCGDLYDFSTRRYRKTSARDICNWLIHSYVFALSFRDDGGLHGLYFNSDRTKHDGLFFLTVTEAARALRTIALLHPTEARYIKDGDDYLVETGLGTEDDGLQRW